MTLDEFQKNIFDTHDTKSHKELVDLRIENIVNNVIRHSKAKLTILEVGCGGGQLLAELTRSCNVYGIDVSENALKVASERGYITTVCNIETESFPFNDNKFDIVVMNDVLEHVINIDHCLREIYRVLKREGQFVLGIPNVSQPVSWIMQAIFDLPPMMSARYKSPHVRDFTLRMTRIILFINGFKTINVAGTYLYPLNNRVGRMLANKFPRLSERLVITSAKNHLPLHEPDIVFDLKEFLRKYENNRG